MASERPDPQLYLVTPPAFEPAAFVPLVEAALDAAPVACLQLWLADGDDDALRTAAKALRDVVQGRDTAFVLNGHVKLAAWLGCDGVHLDRASPAEVKAAKKVLGEDAIVGVSCGHSRHEAMEAGEAGADYVSFGPIRDSRTKDMPGEPAALETLAWWAEMMEIPCVAVGGLTAETLKAPIEAGADFICAVSAVWEHPDGPAVGVRALNEAMRAAAD